MLLSQGWLGYARASASGWTMAAAFLTLVAFSVFAFLFLRWFERRALAPRRLETRFSKTLYALLTMLRIALTAPAVVAAAVLILDAFGLMPERFMNIGFGLAAAIGIAAFGRGVAVGLFAVDDPDRRLISIRDEVAQLVASHLVWAARVLGAIVFLNIVQQAIVAPVSLTVATSAIFAILIAAILCHFLFRVGRSEVPDDEISGVGWLRAGGWLLVIGIVAALLTGFIGLAAFLAGRFLVALGADRRSLYFSGLHRCAVHRRAQRLDAARQGDRQFLRTEAAHDRASRHAVVRILADSAGPGGAAAAARSLGHLRRRFLRRGARRHLRSAHRRSDDFASPPSSPPLRPS